MSYSEVLHAADASSDTVVAFADNNITNTPNTSSLFSNIQRVVIISYNFVMFTIVVC
jgi:hypothetical protein